MHKLSVRLAQTMAEASIDKNPPIAVQLKTGDIEKAEQVNDMESTEGVQGNTKNKVKHSSLIINSIFRIHVV